MAKKRKQKYIKPQPAPKCPPEDYITAIDLAHKTAMQINGLHRHLRRMDYKTQVVTNMEELTGALFDDYFNSMGGSVAFEKRRFTYKKK